MFVNATLAALALSSAYGWMQPLLQWNHAGVEEDACLEMRLKIKDDTGPVKSKSDIWWIEIPTGYPNPFMKSEFYELWEGLNNAVKGNKFIEHDNSLEFVLFEENEKAGWERGLSLCCTSYEKRKKEGKVSNEDWESIKRSINTVLDKFTKTAILDRRATKIPFPDALTCDLRSEIVEDSTENTVRKEFSTRMVVNIDSALSRGSEDKHKLMLTQFTQREQQTILAQLNLFLDEKVRETITGTAKAIGDFTIDADKNLEWSTLSAKITGYYRPHCSTHWHLTQKDCEDQSLAHYGTNGRHQRAECKWIDPWKDVKTIINEKLKECLKSCRDSRNQIAENIQTTSRGISRGFVTSERSLEGFTAGRPATKRVSVPTDYSERMERMEQDLRRLQSELRARPSGRLGRRRLNSLIERFEREKRRIESM